MTAVATRMLPHTAQATGSQEDFAGSRAGGPWVPRMQAVQKVGHPTRGEGGVPVILRLVSLAQVPVEQLQLDVGTLHAVLGRN